MRRRDLLIGGYALASSLRGSTALDVAYAGSMASAMEGPVKQAAAAQLQIEIQGRAQGASGLAQLIVSGSIRPDVFISVTPGPMKTVLKAGQAQRAFPIARTGMVIAYNPNGRFAPRLKQGPWWQVLEEPGFRFGRTDPVTDPQGRNILFVMQLAAEFYQQPDLARRILGEDINPRQIFTEPSVQARLQSGELDAASAYKVQPAAFGLPSIALPDEINLGNSRFAEQYRRVSITLKDKTWRPEPLVYYAAALRGANHPREAAKFVEWLRTKPGQEIFTQLSYDPPGAASELT